MRLTTLPEVYLCCEGKGGEEMHLEPETMQKARRWSANMMEYGG